MVDYKILMHDLTYQKVRAYFQDLKEKQADVSSSNMRDREKSIQALEKAMQGRKIVKIEGGKRLQKSLEEVDLFDLSIEEFIECLVRTKEPQIFAESAVSGDGSDWNQTELSILGDISIGVPVIVYDDGKHDCPQIQDNPFEATLLYTPGALLRNGRGCMPADWGEVIVNDKFTYKGYYSLYKRRLLPAFIYANSVAESKNKKAFITIPGLGCGQFAGQFQGQLGEVLRRVLIEFLNKYGEHFSNIKAVYYDPYNECSNERFELKGISLLIRPFTQGNENKPQLCEPQTYEEDKDYFGDCELFSFVAWDHVSWPGNDFYIGSRATDDGVKAAATNSMAVMTGVKGIYDKSKNTYNPPKEYTNWDQVILKKKIQLHVKDNLLILDGV